MEASRSEAWRTGDGGMAGEEESGPDIFSIERPRAEVEEEGGWVSAIAFDRIVELESRKAFKSVRIAACSRPSSQQRCSRSVQRRHASGISSTGML